MEYPNTISGLAMRLNTLHMNTRFAQRIPIIYLILIALGCWAPQFSTDHYLIINILALLLLQLYVNNRTLGLVLMYAVFLVNILFLLALISAFNKFTTVNINALQLIIVGSLFLGANLFMSYLIFKNYYISYRPKGSCQEEPTGI